MTTQKMKDLFLQIKKWQALEEVTIKKMDEIVSETRNPVVHTIMGIIKADSENHWKVQELLLTALQRGVSSWKRDDIDLVRNLIDEHNSAEKNALEYAKEGLKFVKDRDMKLEEYLLRYLLLDEVKHDRLLENLKKIESLYEVKKAVSE